MLTWRSLLFKSLICSTSSMANQKAMIRSSSPPYMHKDMLTDNQVKISVWSNARRRHIRYCKRGRWPNRKGCREDHPQKECQRERADGLRRARDATKNEAPTYCQVRWLVWIESEIWIFDKGKQELTYLRTSIILSRNWPLVESCSTVFASKEDSQRRMPRKPFDRFLKPWTIYMTIMLFTEVRCSSFNTRDSF